MPFHTQCRLYELRNRERISAAAASKLLSNMAYNYKVRWYGCNDSLLKTLGKPRAWVCPWV